MFLASFPSGLWQANCYVVAAPGAADCVVIDPGQDAAGPLSGLLAEHGLVPAAVLATHGHFDHIGSAAEVANRHQVPVWIHGADRHLLADPAAGWGDDAGQLRALLPTPWPVPREVADLATRTDLTVAGLTFSIVPAPGHTPGSVLLSLAYPDPAGQVDRIVFSGDVLFAGSVGRTDLPGGDQAAMLRTLAEAVLPLPDTAAVLPGHGPQTTMAVERQTNPYLQPAFLRN